MASLRTIEQLIDVEIDRDESVRKLEQLTGINQGLGGDKRKAESAYRSPKMLLTETKPE